MTKTGISGFSTFGDLLKYLRKRAQLTQRELAIAVGYSEAHVSRLEKNQRLPDLATTAALIIPALGLKDEPETAARLMQLAASIRGDHSPANQSFTVAQRRETIEVSEISESIPSNIPLQLTSFIGRQAEMHEITKLLSRENPARLVTLVGPGGIGKTRLSLQTTIGLLHLYRDGIWFVDLAPISSPELVPQVIASVFEVTETPGQSIEESLITSLRSKHALILFDNCEHLIHAAARAIEKILRTCANIQILATSREPLSILGEMIFQLHPLSFPEIIESTNQDVLRHDSVQLFIERAHNIQPASIVADSNLPVIARICRRLDGMPLAIELAAARINILSLNQIEARLDDRFRLLTGGQITLPRHQTLRATLEWSHDLLDEAEKVLFRRLSVFVRGWTLEAGNTVCADDANDILDLLSQLIKKSLVVVERGANGEVHYTMLETIREYAREGLHAAEETEQIRARHFDYFFTKAQQAEPKLFTEESSIDWAEAEIDNLRAALTWALERDSSGAPSEERTGRALELMLHLWPLWLNRGFSVEGEGWLNRLLSVHKADTPARVRALLTMGDLAGFRRDDINQTQFVQEALTLARKLGDRKLIGTSLMEMGLTVRDHQYPEAVQFFTKSLAIFQELNETLWICRTSFLLAQTYFANGDLEAAKRLWEQGLNLARKENDKWQMGWGLEGLGDLERLEGRLEHASELYAESLKLRVEVMDKIGIGYVLESFAQLAAAQEEFRRATVLCSATEQWLQTLNLLLDPARQELHTLLITTARAKLGEEGFTGAWMTGEMMKLQQVIDYVLSPSD
jgi:predicted ATPase/transcriptional regulator with XRE-family HTH domain